MRMKVLLVILLILVSGFIYYQFIDVEPTIKPMSPASTILAIGDSLTAGTGTTKANAYPQQLENISGYKVINAGISGNTSEQALKRLPQLLQTYNPKLVIILIGGNDFIKKSSIKNLQNNIESMIIQSQKSGAQVILLGVPETSLSMKVPDFYQSIAKKYDAVYNGKILRKLLRDKRYKSDTVHLNVLGYHALAIAINQMIAK